MSTPPIVLASSSAYRRALLERLRLPFEVRTPETDETPLPGEAPRATALRLARAKAQSVADSLGRGLIIGSDQTASLDGVCLGKPLTHGRAVAQLQAMRGRTVEFQTALVLLNASSGTLQSDVIPTHVRFRRYSDAEIERYLEAERPYDCTGSAKIEGLGIVLVDAVTGDDPSALIGLPLIRLGAMLRREGVSVV